jgi:hypothetical protein
VERLEDASVVRQACQLNLLQDFWPRPLAVTEKTLGPDHPNLAPILEDLAALYRKTEREAEAKELGKRAAAIRAIRR